MKIALLGAPFTGKTTLLQELSKRGIKVFSTDKFIMEKLYKKGQVGYELIKNNFGVNYVNDIEVDKKKLANLVLKDSEVLTKINSLIHPIVRDYLSDKDNFVAEIPIMAFSTIQFDFDKRVYLKCDMNVLNLRVQNKLKFLNYEFIETQIQKWNNSTIKYDLLIDTSDGIKEKDILKIVNLLK